MVKREPGDVLNHERQPPSDPPPLGYFLRQAAAAHRLRMERALADIDITPPQFLIMTMLAFQDGQSSADIARRASLTPATISVIIANLKRRGVLARSPQAINSRAQPLALTENGHTLLLACRARAAEVEAELAAGLIESSAKLILDWLKYVSAQS